MLAVILVKLWSEVSCISDGECGNKESKHVCTDVQGAMVQTGPVVCCAMPCTVSLTW